MFLGTSDHSLDAKGRVILPSKFREELGECFYITKGFEKCVQVMSVDEFDRLRAQIRALPADKALSLQYLLISPAVLVTPNSQGRVVISQKLREDAGLTGEITVVGMDSRIGSLEVGKDADIVIWTADPLAKIGGEAYITIINGQVVCRKD